MIVEIDELRKRIKDIEECREVEKFGVQRFMASDSDIRFYTGLPDYATFIALYIVSTRPRHCGLHSEKAPREREKGLI